MGERISVQWERYREPGHPPELGDQLTCRVASILQSWEGTPYMHGTMLKGVAVYCIGFGVAVTDELYGFSRGVLPKLPGDTAFHNRKKARAAMRLLLRAYSCHRPVKGDRVQPGDWVIARVRGGGPTHAMIVGPEHQPLWHATRPAVSWTGTNLAGANYELEAIYRATDRRRWLLPEAIAASG